MINKYFLQNKLSIYKYSGLLSFDDLISSQKLANNLEKWATDGLGPRISFNMNLIQYVMAKIAIIARIKAF